MKSLTTICVVVVLLSSMANAKFTAIGDPIKTNSWVEQFEETTPTMANFDLIGIRMTSAGDSFEHPAMDQFLFGNDTTLVQGDTLPGNTHWHLAFENDATNPTLASAAGPSLDDLVFDIRFAGDQDNPLEFDFVAFAGNTMVDSGHVIWPATGDPPTYSTTTWTPSRAELIPAPGAILLGSIGVSLVGWLKRRRAL